MQISRRFAKHQHFLEIGQICTRRKRRGCVLPQPQQSLTPHSRLLFSLFKQQLFLAAPPRQATSPRSVPTSFVSPGLRSVVRCIRGQRNVGLFSQSTTSINHLEGNIFSRTIFCFSNQFLGTFCMM